jgi:hypothetical protein
MSGRTSTVSPNVNDSGGDLDRAVVALAFDDAKAHQHLLSLRIRPIGRNGSPFGLADGQRV